MWHKMVFRILMRQIREETDKILALIPDRPKDKPPLLSIEDVKAHPSYNEYLKTISYDMAKRAVQREADIKHYGG